MKQKYFLLFIPLFSFFIGASQSNFGLELGYSSSLFYSKSFITANDFKSFNLGFQYKLPIGKENLFLLGKTMIKTKGYVIETMRDRLISINQNALLQYTLGKKINFSFAIGLFVDYHAIQQNRFTIEGVANKDWEQKKFSGEFFYNKFDGGISIESEIRRKAIGLVLGAQYGLVDFNNLFVNSNEESIKVYSRYLNLGLRYYF